MSEKRVKKIWPKGEPTPSVESTYQVSWLHRCETEDGKPAPGEWGDGGLHKSFGRKALAASIRSTQPKLLFRIRKVA